MGILMNALLISIFVQGEMAEWPLQGAIPIIPSVASDLKTKSTFIDSIPITVYCFLAVTGSARTQDYSASIYFNLWIRNKPVHT